MATSPKKSLALDTNLLLDLAGEKDFAHEFKEEFASRGYSLLVPPTVIGSNRLISAAAFSLTGLFAPTTLKKHTLFKAYESGNFY